MREIGTVSSSRNWFILAELDRMKSFIFVIKDSFLPNSTPAARFWRTLVINTSCRLAAFEGSSFVGCNLTKKKKKERKKERKKCFRSS